MIERDFYIAQLENFIDKPFVKIITGIRRSGKSSILILFKERLIAKVHYRNILSMSILKALFMPISERPKTCIIILPPS